MPRKQKDVVSKTIYIKKEVLNFYKIKAKKENKFFTEVIHEALEKGIKNGISK
jgi:predicted CopG family antitoxin